MKDININSGEWCDVVFKDKNKQYGAYRLRQTSSKRHVVALIVILILMLVISFLPGLISAVKELNKANDLGTMEDEMVMSNIPVEQELPQEQIAKQEMAPPPPPLKSTIKFTPPVIKKDDEVKEEDEMKAVSEVLETKLQVSMADVKGTDEKFGIAIDELKEHKVIVEEKPQEKPFTTVEQMPTYPGGETEMYSFISKQLKYPVTAQESGIQGRVIVRFVVTSTGEISDVKVLRGIDPACDKEATRVVKMMPKWVPGKQNGRNVAVYFTLPIIFKLQ
ncbi:energy transducer TonB [Dysgonomonas massiliensis]|uniref:energy transducer TonB n=1 Tax=Dysgonomonas massiliensis TaxID=2040292 RepID=UPI00160E035E|nr:energy transducer TonB [Dysgonomonas massiliensis]